MSHYSSMGQGDYSRAALQAPLKLRPDMLSSFPRQSGKPQAPLAPSCIALEYCIGVRLQF